jgi:hypothetical protein
MPLCVPRLLQHTTTSLAILAALLLAVPSAPSAVHADDASVLAIRHGSNAEHTRVVVDLSVSTTYRVSRVESPPVIEVEINAVLPEDAPEYITIEDRRVRGIRIKRLEKRRAGQLCLELNGDARFDAFTLSASGSKPERIVLDVKTPGSRPDGSSSESLARRAADSGELLVDSGSRAEPGRWVSVDSRNGSSGTLELQVIDAETGDPIPYANVLRGDGGGYIVDGMGTLRLDGLPAGDLPLRVVHVSYESSPDLLIGIDPGRETRRTVQLTRRTLAMETVEVRSDRSFALRETASGAQRVTAEAAVSLPNPGDDPFQMIQVLPSVSTGDLGSAFHMRGGGMDETLVRIDGVEVRQLFHGRDFGGITGIIPMGIVDEMQVYPGGFPAEYGGRLSGVIDVDLLSEGEPGFSGLVGADLFATRFLGQAHGDRGTVLVSVREGYLDRVLEALEDETVVRPAYRDLLVRGVHRSSETREVSLNYLRSEDHILYEDGFTPHNLDADYIDHYIWTTGRYTPSSQLEFRGTLHRSSSRYVSSMGENGKNDQEIERVGGRFQAHVLRPGGHFIKFGGEVTREWGEYDLRAREVVNFAPDGTASTVAEFAQSSPFNRIYSAYFLQDEWSPHRSVILGLGLRATHDTKSDSLRYHPRGSLALRLPGSMTLKGAWGSYEQSPSFALVDDGGSWTRSEHTNRAEHRIVGLEKRVGSMRVGLDAYDKLFHELDGVITWVENGGVEGLVITEGRARGVEAYVNRKTSHSNLWFSYTLGRSEWGNAERTYARDFDRLHMFTIANTYEIARDWDVGLAYTYHSGVPYTEQSVDWNESTRLWTLEEGVPNGARLPDYHRLDVRLRRLFHFDDWELTVYAEALNLTNHENVLWYVWGKENREEGEPPQRVTRTGVPGIPSVGMEIRF